MTSLFGTSDIKRVRRVATAISALAWLLVIARPTDGHHVHHGSVAVANWLTMLMAMMAPVLIAPLVHVRRHSFTHRRRRGAFLFVSGYGLTWMLFLVTLEKAQGRVESAAAVVIVALVWQCAPIKQRCLNHCHALPELAAFGVAADIEVFRFGITYAVWCIGSCWALMWVSMAYASVAPMIVVSFLVVSERFERPASPTWKWRGTQIPVRILVARCQKLFAKTLCPVTAIPLFVDDTIPEP
jgi:predicted metal-binding membrane protein